MRTPRAGCPAAPWPAPPTARPPRRAGPPRRAPSGRGTWAALALLLAACGGAGGEAAGGLGPDGAPDAAVTGDAAPVTPDVVADTGGAAPDAPACGSDGACADRLGPGACERAACVDGACVLLPRPDGAPCDDGDPCTSGSACLAGACAGGAAVPCRDDNPCTEDGCDPTVGCRFLPAAAGKACNDKDPCTVDDACTADAACQGTADPACTCASDADCAVHEDDNLCNGTLACAGGQCALVPGSVVACAPAGPCRVAACAPTTGECTTLLAPNGTACDDGNPCSAGDACDEGVCAGVAGACACDSDADCKAVQPGAYDLCLGPLACLGGTCAPDPAKAVTCPAGDPDGCVTTACDPGTGVCATLARPDGAPCAGDDPCAPPGACQQGACQVGPASCDDGNPCTADTCDPVAGCLHAPIDGACDDGNPCTEGEACDGGACVGGQGVVCDDLNPCTADKCVPAAGGCLATPLEDGAPCASGNPCLGGGTCEAGACVGQAPVTCPAAGPCEAVACVPGKGCVATLQPDGAACQPADPCLQAGTCKEGACKALPLPCSDGNPCTLDACDPEAGGCVHEPAANGAPCPAADPCVEGATCYGGECLGGGPVVCPADPCAERACDPAAGACVVVSAALDGTPCAAAALCGAAGACKAGQCKALGGPPCDDGDPCTLDACAGACVHVPLVCDQPADGPCLQAFCEPAAGCATAANDGCAAPTLLLATSLPCAEAAAWTFGGKGGGPALALDADAPPPGPWGAGCSVNAGPLGGLGASGAAWESWAGAPPVEVEAADLPATLQVDLVEWWAPLAKPAGLTRAVQVLGPAGDQWQPLGGEASALDGGWTPRHVAFAVAAPGVYTVRLWLGGPGLPAPAGAAWFVDDLVVGLAP